MAKETISFLSLMNSEAFLLRSVRVGVFEIAQHITTVMLCLVRNWGVEAACEALGCWDLCLTQRLGAKYCRTTTAALGTQHPL